MGKEQANNKSRSWPFSPALARNYILAAASFAVSSGFCFFKYGYAEYSSWIFLLACVTFFFSGRGYRKHPYIILNENNLEIGDVLNRRESFPLTGITLKRKKNGDIQVVCEKRKVTIAVSAAGRKTIDDFFMVVTKHAPLIKIESELS